MKFFLSHFSKRILFLINQLEFDKFSTSEKRASMRKELSSLLFQRDQLLKAIEENQTINAKK